MNWRPTDQVRLSFLYSQLTLDRRSDGSNMSIERIPRLSLEYQVSWFFFVRLVGQYASVRRDALRAGDTDEPIFLFDSDTGGWLPSEPFEENEFTGDVLLPTARTRGRSCSWGTEPRSRTPRRSSSVTCSATRTASS